MVCTEQRDMTMANGKKFSTGNHPVELLLPMMHLVNAGFEIDVVTPTGAPVQIEMWAMPTSDTAVMSFFDEWKPRLDKPGTVGDFAANEMADDSAHIAVFIPGGHGAMLGLPDNADVGRVLRWFHQTGRHTLAICHGPAALLAAGLAAPAPGNGSGFIYSGYEIAAFPDRIDRQTPRIGYMPGTMPWHFGERLEELGVTIVNSRADTTCHVDRRLITGASPKAANAFGRLAAAELLAHYTAQPDTA